MKNTCDNSKNRIEQMVDGIVGKETRQHLAGRAAEYFMFMDDDGEHNNGK